MANKIMNDLDAVDKIDFDQFKKFLGQNPRIMEVFSGSFKEDIWSSRLRDMNSMRQMSARKGRGCCSLSLRSVTSLKVSTKATSSFAQEKSGWVRRKTKEQTTADKVYIVLRSGMLLVYLTPSVPMPGSVIFLEGCYIDPLAEFTQSQRHGFAISHQFEKFQQVSFWCDTKEERDEWVQRLSQSARSSKLEDFYNIRERLGSGRFSDVYKAVEISSGFEWAVKIVEKTRLADSEREMLRSEVAIMRLLNHPNVVQMKEVFEDKSKMYLVMELVEGGELFDLIRTKRVFTEFTAFHITRQLLQIVKYLHEAGIVHRDIKPENILLSDELDLPTVKLADFGLAKLVGTSESLRDGCGTLGYVAPEVLREQEYGKQVDLWSVGVVTYLMLRGRLPFDNNDKFIVMQKTIEEEADFSEQYWSKFTPYAADLVGKLLNKDPALRPTCDQALAHPWLLKGEVLIPRKINKTALKDSLKKTITNAKLQRTLFSEHPRAASLSADTTYDVRLIYTVPDVFEDMKVERHEAEHSLTRLRESNVCSG
jgi:serine/threonine protein kinase